MNPIGLLLLWAASKGGGGTGTTKPDQAVNAYQVPAWMLMVVDLGTGGLSLVLADQEQVGFVTDGTKVVTVRYGTMDKANVALGHFKEGKPKDTLLAKYYGAPNAVVIKGPHIATTVFDADNIATVDSGKFLGKCFQGTTQTCSALISKILGAGINLDPSPAALSGRDYTLHHGRVPAQARSWTEALEFLHGEADVGRDQVLHHGHVPAHAHKWRDVIHFLNR